MRLSRSVLLSINQHTARPSVPQTAVQATAIGLLINNTLIAFFGDAPIAVGVQLQTTSMSRITKSIYTATEVKQQFLPANFYTFAQLARGHSFCSSTVPFGMHAFQRHFNVVIIAHL